MAKETLDKPKILIVRPDAIGDVVLMLPLINTIRANLPQAQIFTLQQNYTAAVFQAHPAIQNVILDWKKLGKIKNWFHFWHYAQYLKSFHFDVVIFSYLDFFYAFLMFLAKIPVRIGDSQKIFLRLFLTHPIKQNFRNLTQHEVEQNIALFEGAKKLFKLDQIKIDLSARLYTSEIDEKSIEEILITAGSQKEPLICIHPTSGGGNRAWLPEKYGELIALIHGQTPYRVVLTGASAKEQALNQKIMANLDPSVEKKPLNLAGKTSLGELKALIKRCAVVIGTDTGPTHLAAALGVKVLIISPSKFVKALRWGPWLTPNKIVRPEKPCLEICYPYQCQKNNCLEAIEPKTAFEQLQKLLAAQSTTAPITCKQEWFRASVNIGFYLGPDFGRKATDLVILEKYLNYLTDFKINFQILCAQKETLNLVKAKINLNFAATHLPYYNFYKLFRFIWQNDINALHLWPPKYLFFWRFFVRQIAALKLYCPPQIFTFQDLPQSPEELICFYLNTW